MYTLTLYPGLLAILSHHTLSICSNFKNLLEVQLLPSYSIIIAVALPAAAARTNDGMGLFSVKRVCYFSVF